MKMYRWLFVFLLIHLIKADDGFKTGRILSGKTRFSLGAGFKASPASRFRNSDTGVDGKSSSRLSFNEEDVQKHEEIPFNEDDVKNGNETKEDEERRWWPFGSSAVSSIIKSAVEVENCGHAMLSKSSADRIVGGHAAGLGEFPWQASLQMKQFFTESYYHYCGAAILNKHWLITAAHCMDGMDTNRISVVSGSLTNQDTRYSVRRYVDKVIVHEGYLGVKNDIALVRVSRPFDISPRGSSPVNGICLPSSDISVGTEAIVTGWGRIREGGSSSETLQAVSVPVISDAECRRHYGKSKIAESMICAGLSKGGKDACQGDSGGPMIVYREDHTAVLAGVVSWGRGCARAGYPGVYTEVAMFRDWIIKNAIP